MTARQSERARLVRSHYQEEATAADYADSYSGWGPGPRYFQSRLVAVLEALHRSPGGTLLDVGCGPGMVLRRVIDERSGDFRVSGVDMSPEMIRAAAARLGDVDGREVMVGRAESLPLEDESFDVVIGTGVLEYCDAPQALREIARVTRPGGLVLVSMLNPFSPYRLFEWCVYWPVARVLGIARRLASRRFTGWPRATHTGIRALPERRLRRTMGDVALRTDDVVYYDLNWLLPPIDRILRRWARRWRGHVETTTGRGGLSRWTGTAYLITAVRDTRVEPNGADGR